MDVLGAGEKGEAQWENLPCLGSEADAVETCIQNKVSERITYINY